VTLHATDHSGARATATGSFNVEQVTLRKKRVERIADRTIDRYSLILFDFDAATLGAANGRIVDFVKGRLAPDAMVTVTGHTDRTGAEEYNARLSARRATATAETLAHPNTTATGLGESNLLFDNELPEGRFYCRTVNIVVETPIE
jgi:outer membrane protein OmpA-like peptidoglycan-associated protein